MENPPLEGTQLALRVPGVEGTPAHNFTLRTGKRSAIARTPSFSAPPGSVLNFTLLVQDTQVRHTSILHSAGFGALMHRVLLRWSSTTRTQILQYERKRAIRKPYTLADAALTVDKLVYQILVRLCTIHLA